MKRILSILSITGFMTASCNTTPKTHDANSIAATPDTTGYAQFQQWKAQSELATTNQNLNNTSAAQPTRTVVKYVPVKSSNSGSMSSSSSNTAKASQKKGWSKAA